mgnify:CR=1 FL=1
MGLFLKSSPKVIIEDSASDSDQSQSNESIEIITPKHILGSSSSFQSRDISNIDSQFKISNLKVNKESTK